jgi:hypothetical protein
VIGGGIGKAGEALFDPLARGTAAADYGWSAARIDVVPAALGDAIACSTARWHW